MTMKGTFRSHCLYAANCVASCIILCVLTDARDTTKRLRKKKSEKKVELRVLMSDRTRYVTLPILAENRHQHSVPGGWRRQLPMFTLFLGASFSHSDRPKGITPRGHM
jgi:hypothetical protein